MFDKPSSSPLRLRCKSEARFGELFAAPGELSRAGEDHPSGELPTSCRHRASTSLSSRRRFGEVGSRNDAFCVSETARMARSVPEKLLQKG